MTVHCVEKKNGVWGEWGGVKKKKKNMTYFQISKDAWLLMGLRYCHRTRKVTGWAHCLFSGAPLCWVAGTLTAASPGADLGSARLFVRGMSRLRGGMRGGEERE